MATYVENLAGVEESYDVDVILIDVKNIIGGNGDLRLKKQSFKQLIAYLERMQPILEHLENVKGDEMPSALQTALKGIKINLQRAQDFAEGKKEKSLLYWLVHSHELNKELEEVTRSIGQWLSLFSLAGLQQSHGLTRKVEDLSLEMQKAHFKATEIEDRLLMALEEEPSRLSSDLHALNAIIMDMGRLLGIDPERNQEKFANELRLLKQDLQDCDNDHELQLSGTIDKIFQAWMLRSELLRYQSFSDPGDDEPMSPFESFLCPLTKQVMKDPVVLQSEVTYERSAIENWFETCIEQGHVPTCPVSCQMLSSTELLPNLVLRQTIEEWLQRNAKIRIRLAMSRLESMSSLEEHEHALEDLVRISNECPLSKYKLKEAGLISLILRFWESDSKSTSDIRSKCLAVLNSMATGNVDNQGAMVEAGVLRYAVKSLGSSLNKEVEGAVALMFEVSEQQIFCEKIGLEKGAIIHLVGLVSNTQENLSVSDIAEQILTNLERVDSNVLQMAEAGRFQPLFMRLFEGSEVTQMKMAEYLAQRVLVNSQKELVARRAGVVLVKMLFSDLKVKEVALGALLNLSSLEDNILTLIKAGILPPLLSIIFAVPTIHNPAPINLKETAAATLAHLLCVPGNWESIVIDSEGNTLQSEIVIHKLLGLLTFIGPNWKDKILQILHEMASSPQAADSISKHMKTGNGLPIVVRLMQDSDARVHLNALKLLSSLSVQLGPDAGHALTNANQLSHLKEILKGKNVEERVAAASIISNIPFTESQVIEILQVELVSWTVAAINDLKLGKLGKSSARTSSVLLEGLFGVLLQFTRYSNPTIVQTVCEQGVMTVLRDHLLLHGQPLVKQRAALGLKLLSDKSPMLTKGYEVLPQNMCASLMLLCKPKRPPSHVCRVHLGICDINTSFCLVEGNALRPLVELLDDDSHEVRLAAIKALSTLLSDAVNLNGGVEELVKVDGAKPIFELLVTARPGVLQDKLIWIVERILRVEEYAQGHAMDQHLFKTLVEVFKHGSPTTKRLAEDALTHLKQLSGIGGVPAYKKSN
ncbi:hypothetical protein O6H91_10G079700 [Diphasiastrum complanatum]|uniref:Uncharacterized protein n=1 Tax=Diphasiastrum complanatum TaxID=34168 RepID=A0ACC2CIV4_DIPCM|nr:hypothetical protein O6H91_10G079700 [Diphasiastrum complanatum]